MGKSKELSDFLATAACTALSEQAGQVKSTPANGCRKCVHTESAHRKCNVLTAVHYGEVDKWGQK